ncbi:MAG: hypothetical protein ACXW3P_10275, partial [Rhodospirillales bacterium]
IEELRSRLNEMQRQLDEFVSRRDDRVSPAPAQDKEAPAVEPAEETPQGTGHEAGQAQAKRARAGGA